MHRTSNNELKIDVTDVWTLKETYDPVPKNKGRSEGKSVFSSHHPSNCYRGKVMDHKF